jgi:hypothetical protein
MFYQQGDVIIERKEIPKDAEKIEEKSKDFIVLAEGEVTGHAHRIATSDSLEVAERKQKEGTTYLFVGKPLPILHEEHKSFVIRPGDNIVRGVIEYDPFQIKERRVAD